MSDIPSGADEWYFDVKRGVAVRASERGHADDLLGPYPTRSAAENWQTTHKSRSDAWAAEDERWEHQGENRDR
jgi:hypothetical protein